MASLVCRVAGTLLLRLTGDDVTDSVNGVCRMGEWRLVEELLLLGEAERGEGRGDLVAELVRRLSTTMEEPDACLDKLGPRGTRRRGGGDAAALSERPGVDRGDERPVREEPAQQVDAHIDRAVEVAVDEPFRDFGDGTLRRAVDPTDVCRGAPGEPGAFDGELDAREVLLERLAEEFVTLDEVEVSGVRGAGGHLDGSGSRAPLGASMNFPSAVRREE